MAAFLPVPKPLQFSGNVSQAWKDWRTKFEVYLMAMDYEKKDTKVKVGVLLNLIGDEAIDIYSSFDWAAAGDKWKLDKVLEKFENHCNPRKSTFKHREELWQMRQGPDQSVDQFLSEIRRKMKECDLGTDDELKDSLLKQRLIAGIKDEACRQRMADKGDELTLENAIKMARNTEATKAELKQLGYGKQEPQSVHALTDHRKPKTSHEHVSHSKNFSCGRCGKSHPPRSCPAFGQTCRKCGRKSHFAKMCRSRGQYQYKGAASKPNTHGMKQGKYVKRNVHEMQMEEQSNMRDSSDSYFYVDAVDGEKHEKTETDWWIVPIQVQNSVIPFKLDTGSNVNVLSMNDYKLLSDRSTKLLPSKSMKVTAYTGTEIPIQGQARVTLKYKGQVFQSKVVVTPCDVQPILGLPDCERLNLVKRVWTVIQDDDEEDDYLGEMLKERSKERTQERNPVPPSGQNKEKSQVPPGSKTRDTQNQRPEVPPGGLTAEYVYENWIDILERVGELPGDYEFKIDEDVEPVQEACRSVPFSLYEPFKQGLMQMVDLNILAKVTKPTKWVSSFVLRRKKNGELRICLDPRNLNKAIKREHYKLPTREEMAAKFEKASDMSKLDASKGFWQVKLGEKSSYLTTFATPFGRFRFLRLPFGINCAPEVFHRIITEMFDHIPGVDTSMDDVRVIGQNQQEHDERLIQVLETARKNGLTFNWAKCEINAKEMVFLGDLFTKEGLKPDPAKVQAIKDMKRPHDEQSLSRFIGLVNYLGRFIPNVSAKTAPLREINKKGNEWIWTEKQEEAWKELKEVIMTEPVMEYYDPEKETMVTSDASKGGLGAGLLQKTDGYWKPVAYASRAMHDEETRYAQIEKEALAIQFACHRFYQYLYGRKFTVETDHKPLVSIFTKSLADCPARIQRFRLRLQKFDFDIVYTPGSKMYIADELSRNYPPARADDNMVNEVEEHVECIVASVQMSKERYSEVRKETQKDEVMNSLMKTVLQGWPSERRECPTELAEYWNFRDEIWVNDGVVYKGVKVIIPRSMRKEMLKKIHVGHLGETKCKGRARQVMFWPRMGHDIENMVKSCDPCTTHKNRQQKEPLLPQPVSTKPWEYLASDLFEHNGDHFVLCVDSYSGYVEVEEIPNQRSSTVVKKMKKIFSRQGIPTEVFNDNGPCYNAEEMKSFAKSWDFEIKTSSPTYAQSNGLAENMVKIVKNIFKKCDESGEEREMGLLVYRSTPLECGLSPAELLQKRQFKSNLPTMPNETDEYVVKSKVQQKERQKFYYDKSAKPLKPIDVGMPVRVRDEKKACWREKGVVMSEIAPRSYIVKTERGAVLRRNRRDLLTTGEKPDIYDPVQEFSDNMLLSADTQSQIEPPSGVIRSPPPSPIRSDRSIMPETSESMNTVKPTDNAQKQVRVENSSDQPVRRSGRVRNKPQRLIEQC